MNRSGILLAAAILTLAPAARAGFFQLELQAGSRVMAGRVAVRAHMSNAGDESMRSLQTAVWFNGAWYRGPQHPALDVAEQRVDDLDVGPLPELPGAYTAVISIRYTDRNGHPFTTLRTIPVHTAEPPDDAPLTAKLNRIAIVDDGELLLTLASRRDTPLAATVRLILPAELQGVPAPDLDVTIPRYGTLQRRLPVAKTWAVPGSQNQVFALVDYVADGRHGSAVAAGAVRVSARPTLAADTLRRLWIVPGALLALYGIAQLRRPRPTR